MKSSCEAPSIRWSAAGVEVGTSEVASVLLCRDKEDVEESFRFGPKGPAWQEQ